MCAVYGYDTKKADSEGLALGAVVLPWTMTALLITDLQKKASSGMFPGQLFDLTAWLLSVGVSIRSRELSCPVSASRAWVAGGQH